MSLGPTGSPIQTTPPQGINCPIGLAMSAGGGVV